MSQNDGKPQDKTHGKTKKDTAKPKGFAAFLARLRAIPKSIAKAFQNMVAELKKVTWPTRKDLINYTLIVIAFMVGLGIIVGVLDLGASGLIKLIVGA